MQMDEVALKLPGDHPVDRLHQSPIQVGRKDGGRVLLHSDHRPGAPKLVLGIISTGRSLKAITPIIITATKNIDAAVGLVIERFGKDIANSIHTSDRALMGREL